MVDDASGAVYPEFVCPECGADLQATETRKRWWTLTLDGKPWVYGEADDGELGDHDGIHVYCGEDHEIPDELAAEVRKRIVAAIQNEVGPIGGRG